MMGPDYTHWHGTYEVAKHFYGEFVPELQVLVSEGLASGDPERIKAAEALGARLEAVLAGENHRWYLGRMDPQEAARRKQAAEEFRARYER
jgi:hypothetical protein